MENDARRNSDQESAGGASNEPAKSVLDTIAGAANQIMDTFIWLGNKLNSNGSVFNMQDAKGATAEVSLAIPPGSTGEITVVIGQTRKHYAARALHEGQEFKQGARVRIADVGVSTMYVETIG